MAQVAGFGGTRFDISDFPTRHPYGLGLWQKHIERILAGWVRELKVPIHYGIELTGFTQDDSGVDVELSDGRSLRAQYLVGCDGGRSLVRKTAGIDFPGWDPTTSSLLAEVEMTEEPELGVRRTPSGTHALGKVEYEVKDGEVVYGKGGTVGVMLTESEIGASEPTLRDLSEGLIAVYGTDYGIHDVTWITRFTDVTRQAAAYRAGRVLLAGDAAHVHSPVGGQGLNTGVQDAVNLGLEAGPGGPRDGAGEPAGYLPRRAPPGRGPRAAQHDGAGRPHAPRRSHRGAARRRVRAVEHGRASDTIRRDDVRSGHPLRPGRGTPAARTPDAGPGSGHRATARDGSSACCTRPGRCCSTSASRAPSTSRHGQLGFSWSTPPTPGLGSFRPSARSPLPPPC